MNDVLNSDELHARSVARAMTRVAIRASEQGWSDDVDRILLAVAVLRPDFAEVTFIRALMFLGNREYHAAMDVIHGQSGPRATAVRAVCAYWTGDPSYRNLAAEVIAADDPEAAALARALVERTGHEGGADDDETKAGASRNAPRYLAGLRA